MIVLVLKVAISKMDKQNNFFLDVKQKKDANKKTEECQNKDPREVGVCAVASASKCPRSQPCPPEKKECLKKNNGQSKDHMLFNFHYFIAFVSIIGVQNGSINLILQKGFLK